MSEKIDFSRLNNSEAFHLIERHANDWAHAGELMDEFAQAKNSQKWISVSERTPEQGARVLFVAESIADKHLHGKVFVGVYRGIRFVQPEVVLFGSHWQPLPEPPK